MVNKSAYDADDEISKVFHDLTKITQTLQAGIQAALLKHKQAGNPICEWQDNEVVWIAPENIKLAEKRE
jgi:hypothetical protein